MCVFALTQSVVKSIAQVNTTLDPNRSHKLCKNSKRGNLILEFYPISKYSKGESGLGFNDCFLEDWVTT